jgi:uncharacterized membrane protein
MIDFKPLLQIGILPGLQHFVKISKLHPILVNFTAALVPVSLASDFIARFIKSESFRQTAWWTLFYATFMTPLTAFTGWLFWMPDDNGDSSMAGHKYLGSCLTPLLFGPFGWRWKLRRQRRWASMPYFVTSGIFVVALIVQGHLGGEKVFNGM